MREPRPLARLILHARWFICSTEKFVSGTGSGLFWKLLSQYGIGGCGIMLFHKTYTMARMSTAFRGAKVTLTKSVSLPAG